MTTILLDSTFELIPGVEFINGLVTPSPGSGESRWNGTGIWNTAANWSNGIPGDSTAAIIESGEVSVQANALCKSLQINTGTATLVLPGSTLTVHDGFVNNGTFGIKSDETGTGSFIARGALSGAGTNYAERYFDFTTGYTSLASSPVQGAQVSVFGGKTTETYSETGTSWTSLLPSDMLQIGEGYRISGSAVSTDVFTGPMANADVPVGNITYTAGNPAAVRGLHLTGNPFQSAIQWNQGNWVKTNIDGAVYVWNGYNYISWNGTIGSLSNGMIPAMQGFFVKSNAAGASLTIPASARVHNQEFVTDEILMPENVLTLKMGNTNDNLHSDETHIQVLPGSTTGFDAATDAYKLFGNPVYPQLYSVASDGNELSINTLPAFDNIPIGIKPGIAGTYKIMFSNQDSFSPDQPIYFEDKSSSTVINIRSTDTYVFSSDGSDEAGRLVLHFEVIGFSDITTASIHAWIENGKLHLASSDHQKSVEQLRLFNLSGQLLYEASGVKVPATLSISACPTGICILQMIMDEGVVTKKLFNR
jgi:hypothetical protein